MEKRKNKLVRLIALWPAFVESFVRPFLLAHVGLPKCFDNTGVDEYASMSGCEGVIVPPDSSGGLMLRFCMDC